MENTQVFQIQDAGMLGRDPGDEHVALNGQLLGVEKIQTWTAPEVSSNEGRKDDTGKVRFELLPPELLYAVSTILTSGAVKYEARNWEKGMSWGRVFGALMRHMWCWWGGKGPTTKSFLLGETDDETGHSHLWHAACCIAFLITYEERGIGQDDRQGTMPASMARAA